jgi:epoxyqueuosine reductase QueG
MYSNWSERHIAYAAGLGTFSLSDGFITERGIAHRCGSVVAAIEIPASPRTASGPYANCLSFVNEKCGVCIKRCPSGAITEKGHDKVKCQEYLSSIGYRPGETKIYDVNTSVFGCGLCQTKVPCEDRNPAKKKKKQISSDK